MPSVCCGRLPPPPTLGGGEHSDQDAVRSVVGEVAEEAGRLAEDGDGLAQRHEVAPLPALGLGRGLLGAPAGLLELGPQPLVLGLQLHHPADAFEVHAFARPARRCAGATSMSASL